MVKVMPAFSSRPVPRCAVVQHLRVFVEHLADAVTAEFAHHRVVVLLGVLLDDVADIAEAAPGLTISMALYRHSWVTCDQALGPTGTRADVEHAAGVAVVAVLDDGDVDVDDVAVLQGFLVRGMPWQTTSLIEVQIDFGKAVVVQRRRDGFCSLTM